MRILLTLVLLASVALVAMAQNATRSSTTSSSSSSSAGTRTFRGVCLDSQLGSVLALSGPGGAQGPRLQLAQGESTWAVEVSPQGSFQIKQDATKVLSVNKKKHVKINGALSAKGLDVASFAINGNAQWGLAHLDTFGTLAAAQKEDTAKEATAGWKYKVFQAPNLTEEEKKKLLPFYILECSGLNIFTAPVAPGFISKTFKKLPPHRFARIVATVHFVDDWQGETAWLKLDNNYSWTETLDQKVAGSQINVCGRNNFPESKFASTLDITIEHSAEKLHVQFGANLENGSEAHFGVSSVQIYLR